MGYAAFVMLMISITPNGKIEPTYLSQHPNKQQCEKIKERLINLNGMQDTSDIICVRNPLSKDSKRNR